MATVTNLADRVCRLTGLQSTGSERTLVLEFLNDAYREAVERSECYPVLSSAISVAADDNETTVTSDIANVNRILNVYLSNYSGYGTLALKPISRRRLIAEQDKLSSYSGIPQYYHLRRTGSTLEMALFPRPESTASMYIEYYSNPPTLVESAPGAGEESTPTAIPTQFHYRVIAAGAIAMALDSDQRKDSGMWWERFDKGIYDLTSWTNQLQGPDVIEPWFDDDRRIGNTDRSRDFG